MTLQEQRDVIQAAIDGKSLEYRRKLPDAVWFDIPSVTTHHFAFHELEYRVKPEPREWFEVHGINANGAWHQHFYTLKDAEEVVNRIPKTRVVRVREVLD